VTTPYLIGRIRAAVALAREHGVDVRYDPGWTGRGRPGFAPAGVVEHCTSDPAVLTTDRMRQVLRDGHGKLSGNAICNAWVRRDDVIEILAAGLAWHAGPGSWRGLSGNPRFWGVEYHRAQSQNLTPAMLDAGAIFTWALCESFDWPPAMVCDHREYAPGRKRDRHGVNGDAWRARIAAGPPTPEEDDPMADYADELTAIALNTRRAAEDAQRQVRLQAALVEAEVARHREALGLEPDPESGAIWSGRIASGTSTLYEAKERLAAVRP
jgi:hypothetical protein